MMEHSISFEASIPGIVVRLKGVGTVDGFIDAIKSVTEHPQFRPNVQRLWDAREADLSKLTHHDLRLIAAASAKELPVPGVRAALVVKRDVDFGIARMFTSLAGHELPSEFGVFREVPAAEDWVRGLEPRGAAEPLSTQRSARRAERTKKRT